MIDRGLPVLDQADVRRGAADIDGDDLALFQMNLLELIDLIDGSGE